MTTPHPVEWLSDNGPPFVADETRRFGARAGLLVVNKPAYSPESSGMAESFVKTFKRDYVYVQRNPDAATVLVRLAADFHDYKEVRPHSRFGPARRRLPRADKRNRAPFQWAASRLFNGRPRSISESLERRRDLEAPATALEPGLRRRAL